MYLLRVTASRSMGRGKVAGMVVVVSKGRMVVSKRRVDRDDGRMSK